jgi:hypothetical protein
MQAYDIVDGATGEVISTVHLPDGPDYDLLCSAAGDLGYYLREAE